ncbi:dsRBD fold-containing protein [Streptomyces mirabilis]|uniref:dsRBD fold-containing protein n=1 Tax=Streptomyces mirabilis TaxID=68239 RepID=UPI003D9E8D20
MAASATSRRHSAPAVGRVDDSTQRRSPLPAPGSLGMIKTSPPPSDRHDAGPSPVAGARALNELAMKLLTKAYDEIDEASGRTSHPLR